VFGYIYNYSKIIEKVLCHFKMFETFQDVPNIQKISYPNLGIGKWK
jgi:hypothetical protein